MKFCWLVTVALVAGLLVGCHSRVNTVRKPEATLAGKPVSDWKPKELAEYLRENLSDDRVEFKILKYVANLNAFVDDSEPAYTVAVGSQGVPLLFFEKFLNEEIAASAKEKYDVLDVESEWSFVWDDWLISASFLKAGMTPEESPELLREGMAPHLKKAKELLFENP